MNEPSVTIYFTPFCFKLNDMERITAFIALGDDRKLAHFKKLYSAEKLKAVFGEVKGKSLFGIFEFELDYLLNGGKETLTTSMKAMPARRAKGFTLDQALDAAAKSVSAFYEGAS